MGDKLDEQCEFKQKFEELTNDNESTMHKELCDDISVSSIGLF